MDGDFTVSGLKNLIDEIKLPSRRIPATISRMVTASSAFGHPRISCLRPVSFLLLHRSEATQTVTFVRVRRHWCGIVEGRTSTAIILSHTVALLHAYRSRMHKRSIRMLRRRWRTISWSLWRMRRLLIRRHVRRLTTWSIWLKRIETDYNIIDVFNRSTFNVALNLL